MRIPIPFIVAGVTRVLFALLLIAGASRLLAQVTRPLPPWLDASTLTGPDTDRDGLPDLIELRFGSSPVQPDTDGDKFTDLDEYIAQTNPRDRGVFPLFFEELRDRQMLPTETLVLRVRPIVDFLLTTNTVIVTNPPPDDMPDEEPTYETNKITVTNWVTFQWFFNTNALPTQTNAALVLHRIGESNAGAYRVEAAVLTSKQTSRALNVEVLPWKPRVRIGQPMGHPVAWGQNTFGQTNVPALVLDQASLGIAGGLAHSVLVSDKGEMYAWGTNDLRQTAIPEGLGGVVRVASGAAHTLALRGDGTVVAWGDNQLGQTNVPPGLSNVVQVAAGYFHSVALRGDGSVVVWGDDSQEQRSVPGEAVEVVAIAAGVFHTVALRADGRVVCWGGNDYGQCDVPDPLDPVGRIAAGGNHTSVLLTDGRVVSWGDDFFGQVTVPDPAPKGVEIAAGYAFTAVLLPDSRVRVWGEKTNAVMKLPLGLSNVVSLSAGYFHALALVGAPDTDVDGLDNPFELVLGTRTNVFDTDLDGLEDGVELKLGTSPLLADSDMDGLPDRVELENDYDALAATERADGWMQVEPMFELDAFARETRSYQLQVSSDGESWSDLGSPASYLQGRTRSLRFPLTGERHYRLIPTQGEVELETGPFPILGTVTSWGEVRRT